MSVDGKVIQVAGPAVDVEFPEGQIPVIRTALRITSKGFDVPEPIDMPCPCRNRQFEIMKFLFSGVRERPGFTAILSSPPSIVQSVMR